MLQFNFKDKYTNQSGANIELNYTTQFYSNNYIGGNGSRNTPYRSNNLTGLTNSSTLALILSSGIHSGSTTTMLGTTAFTKFINGQGLKNTIWKDFVINIPSAGTVNPYLYVKDLTIDGDIAFNLTAPNNAFRLNVFFYSCVINSSIVRTISGYPGAPITINRCLVKKLIAAATNSATTYGNNNSFVGIGTTVGSIAGNLHTFEKCNLIVNQASLDSYKSNYYVFDNCNFRIGTETEYTPLTGTTAEELRSNFVARCTAAGLTVPADITDYGITLTLGRWLFTKNQIFEGITWAGSEINQFEIPRFISFGYSPRRGDKMPITADNNVPASFVSGNPNSGGLDIATDSLSINANIDITQHNNLYIDSKIIWLGGKKKLTNIDMPNNLPQLYGVLIDSIPNLLNDGGDDVAVTEIEPGEMYIVRSSDENVASVTYNGSTYSSALSTRNNIFKGVASATSFVIASGRAVVYKINDILNYQSIQLRIVNQIPNLTANINQLANNYWYLVEHGYDQSNTTDYVTVGGVKYYVGDSFLVTAPTENNSVTGNVHLRRCWAQDFNFDTEVLDKDFWQNEQKPEWCDVLPEDPRCLMKNNSEKSVEMMRGEDGKYITTGHPEYYNRITGASGVQSPSDIFIQGTYMQIRLRVTTANPM